MLDLDFALVTKALLSLVGLWVSSRIYKALGKRRFNNALAKKWGCKPLKRFPAKDPIFALDLFYDFFRQIREHDVLETSRSRFTQLKANTIILPIMGQDIISTLDPENVKTILSTNFDSYALAPLRKSMVPLLGPGIFTVDGALWQNSRNMLRPMFTRSQLTDLSIFELHFDRLKAHIPLDGTEVDLQPLFFHLTLDIASHVFLGESTDCQISNGKETEATKFTDAFNRTLEEFGSGMELEFFGLKWPHRQFDRDCKFIHQFVDSYVIKAMEQKSQGKLEEMADSRSRSVFLHELVSQTDDVAKVRTEILSTILAGRDTTASMMSDLWFEVSKHPQVFSTLRREVDSIQGQDLTLELLKSLKYLRAVLNETLRIHPVVPENARIAVKNTRLPFGGGEDGMSPVLVPKGGLVAWSPYAMQRRKDLFGEDADEFRPKRWVDTEEEKGVRPGWAYVPFNGGPRICIGQQFALAQVSYMTVRLIQMIDSVESRDPEPWREKLTITVTGMGCKVAMTRRT